MQNTMQQYTILKYTQKMFTVLN